MLRCKCFIRRDRQARLTDCISVSALVIASILAFVVLKIILSFLAKVSCVCIRLILSRDISNLSGDACKLLLMAKKVKRTTRTYFLISLLPNNFSRTSDKYMGIIRSNIFGTKFSMYDSQPRCKSAQESIGGQGECYAQWTPSLLQQFKKVETFPTPVTFSIDYLTDELWLTIGLLNIPFGLPYSVLRLSLLPRTNAFIRGVPLSLYLLD
ncbi:hypothetical protein LIER_39135 [Lithospermum erythrorhizon]|uniref:Tubby C-terminal domain-containing protein n=1 Tax=Lithospermum erythrorhizon TaxID=34254 RepID=A0AAV3QEH2_LITER